MKNKIYIFSAITLLILAFAGIVFAVEYKAPKAGDTWIKTVEGETNMFSVEEVEDNGDGSYGVTLKTKKGKNDWWIHPQQKFTPGKGACTDPIQAGNLHWKICNNKNGAIIGKVKVGATGPWQLAPKIPKPKQKGPETGISGPSTPGPFGPAPI